MSGVMLIETMIILQGVDFAGVHHDYGTTISSSILGYIMIIGHQYHHQYSHQYTPYSVELKRQQLLGKSFVVQVERIIFTA
jgi:hypothetical protein